MGEFLSKLKSRKEFEGGLKKTEEFEETSHKSPKKTGKNFDRGGGNNFSRWPKYIPLSEDLPIYLENVCDAYRNMIHFYVAFCLKSVWPNVLHL